MTRIAQTLAAVGLSLPGRLRGTDAALHAGEVTAIVGPNGAGKSTLLGCLSGIMAPAVGSVLLDAEPVAGMASRVRARLIGYLPQTPEVAWDVTVETLVRLGRLPWQGGPLGRSATTPAQDDAAVAGAMAAMDVAGLANCRVSRLSGGERARALAARVLAGQPRWLLADEPLANLDLAHAAALIARLEEQAHAGTGVVLVLHDLAMAMNHADRVLVLNHGRIVADGPPAEVLTADEIRSIWGVQARWLGEPGQRALAHR
ncbi:MAG: ABC transporter ATP-binding protein [Pseudomonadota bacterium]